MAVGLSLGQRQSQGTGREQSHIEDVVVAPRLAAVGPWLGRQQSQGRLVVVGIISWFRVSVEVLWECSICEGGGVLRSNGTVTVVSVNKGDGSSQSVGSGRIDVHV